MDSFRDKQDTVAIVVHVLLRAMTMSLLTLPTFRAFSVQDKHVIRLLRFGAKKLLNIFPVKDGSLEVWRYILDLFFFTTKSYSVHHQNYSEF